MTKSQLISEMAKSTGHTKAVVEGVLNSAVEHMSVALQRGEKVQILPFGIFSVAERSARQGRNPRTGEEITIAARMAVKFKASSGLAESVANGGKAAVVEEPVKPGGKAKPAGK